MKLPITIDLPEPEERTPLPEVAPDASSDEIRALHDACYNPWAQHHLRWAGHTAGSPTAAESISRALKIESEMRHSNRRAVTITFH